jgi:hypothetical protein
LGATWVIGASGKIGRQSFDFLDPLTLAKGSESHQGDSVAASVGVFSRMPYFTTLTYRRVTSYKAGDSATICTPFGAASRCADAVLGAPTKRLQNLMQLEMRQFFGEQVAITPRATYDAKQKVWAFEVPLYLRRNLDDTFNGGVSVGVDTKQHKFVLSLFVGALPKAVTR